jgi:hypothetical protein
MALDPEHIFPLIKGVLDVIKKNERKSVYGRFALLKMCQNPAGFPGAASYYQRIRNPPLFEAARHLL